MTCWNCSLSELGSATVHLVVVSAIVHIFLFIFFYFLLFFVCFIHFGMCWLAVLLLPFHALLRLHFRLLHFIWNNIHKVIFFFCLSFPALLVWLIFIFIIFLFLHFCCFWNFCRLKVDLLSLVLFVLQSHMLIFALLFLLLAVHSRQFSSCGLLLGEAFIIFVLQRYVVGVCFLVLHTILLSLEYNIRGCKVKLFARLALWFHLLAIFSIFVRQNLGLVSP